MTMNDLQPLQLLLAQAEKQRDAALSEHLRAKAAADAAAAQSTQLVDYRREYEQRWHAQFARQGQIELVRCYQQFMEKLTVAVEHQARVAAHALQQIDRTQGALREIELRCASVRKLIERRTRDIRVSDDRRDQKQTDEQAMRAAWAQRDVQGHF